MKNYIAAPQNTIATEALSEKGIYLVFFSLLLIVILAFVALVVTTGKISSTQGRLQRVANIVSQAALVEYETARTAANSNYATRAQAAIERAEDIYRANVPPGFSDNFSGFAHGPTASEAASTLTLGNWYREVPPNGDTNPCTTYPCFVPNNRPESGIEQVANAVQVTVRPAEDSSFDLPFCRIFGHCAQNFEAVAYSTLIQRCVAFVVDLSASTFADTHRYKVPTFVQVSYPAKCLGTYDSTDNIYNCASTGSSPIDAALPFFHFNSSSEPGVHAGDHFANLGGAESSFQVAACQISEHYNRSYEQWFWCNLARDQLNEYRSYRPSGERDPTKHYRSDYMKRRYIDSTNTERFLLVDSFVDPTFYEGPEPYTSFFHAFNSSIRLLQEQSSQSDKAMLRGFSGEIVAKYPDVDDDSQALTGNFGPMIQITNLDNRGTINADRSLRTPEVRPNLLDYNFFWTLTSSYPPDDYPPTNTNIILAINEAANILQNSCPVSALRTIVLATDGIPTCRLKSGSDIKSASVDSFECNSRDFGFYQSAVNQLRGGFPTGYANTVLSRLVDDQIALVIVAAGEPLGINFRNIFTEEGTDGRPMEFGEAYAQGFDRNHLFDLNSYRRWGNGSTSTISDQDGWQYYGYDGYTFSHPLGVLADLAIGSGGVFCPLMPKCGPGHPPPGGSCIACAPDNDATNCCYTDEDGDSSTPRTLRISLRGSNYSKQTCSIYDLSPAQQAAQCVMNFLSGSPYVLVAPES